jgi:hypothetical protein
MSSWDREPIDIANGMSMQVTDPGPLQMPISRFSIRRDEKLVITIETEGELNPIPPAVPPRSDGLPRLRTAQVKLGNRYGAGALLDGVVSTSIVDQHHHPMGRKEVAQVNRLTVTTGAVGETAYTIEWLENLPFRPFCWPEAITTKMETTTTWKVAQDDVVLSETTGGGGFSQAAAKLFVAGQTLYVCALGAEKPETGIKPGCIIYLGRLDDLIRKKIRTALSFALGVYLVELGHTLYDEAWNIISTTSISAYSLDQRAFDLSVMPLASLSKRNMAHDLDRDLLTRMVNALVNNYELLDLGNLSWAYWHALTATVHTAPAQFGAAIEALQRSHIESSSGTITAQLLDAKQWKEVRKSISSIIDASIASDDVRRMLSEQLGGINRLPQRPLLRSVMTALGLELSDDEDSAWKRRNAAAHGTPIPEDEHLAAIRDMHLLRGLFHRLLLRITNATDVYIDYTSPYYPSRPLQEAASATAIMPDATNGPV